MVPIIRVDFSHPETGKSLRHYPRHDPVNVIFVIKQSQGVFLAQVLQVFRLYVEDEFCARPPLSKKGYLFA